MAITITTGPHPSSSGACIAYYNHNVYNHGLHPYHSSPNYMTGMTGYTYQQVPTWRPPVRPPLGSFPQFY